MKPKSGYYSLIQYCPDPGRLESVNLGVVLFCPDIDFLEARIGSNNNRARKFFGRESFDNWALTRATQALVARLKLEREHLLDREALETFIRARANDVILSPLRSVKILKNASDELEELFQELVGTERRRRAKPVLPELEATFQKLRQEGRAIMNLAVKVPVVGKVLTVPYAYRNGATHLVKPERFSNSEGKAASTAMKLAIEGDLLHRYGADQDGEKKLVVVSTIAGEQPNPDVENRIARVLNEYRVKVVLPNQLNEFLTEVRKAAH